MRILVADDHGIARQGLKALIEKQPDMKVVAQAQDGRMALQLAGELSPDIIIMDISMPELNGIEATRLVLAENPRIRVVILSMHSDKQIVREALRAGALAYVLKSHVFDELLKAIQAATANDYYLSPQIADVVIDDYTRSSDAAASAGLTGRERQILQMLAEGQTAKQIALHLGISAKTAHANRRKIRDKLGLKSTADLVKYAIREGLTSVDF